MSQPNTSSMRDDFANVSMQARSVRTWVALFCGIMNLGRNVNVKSFNTSRLKDALGFNITQAHHLTYPFWQLLTLMGGL